MEYPKHYNPVTWAQMKVAKYVNADWLSPKVFLRDMQAHVTDGDIVMAAAYADLLESWASWRAPYQSLSDVEKAQFEKVYRAARDMDGCPFELEWTPRIERPTLHRRPVEREGSRPPGAGPATPISYR